MNGLLHMFPDLEVALRGLGYTRIRTYTWATKPAASAVLAGTMIRISNVGVGPGSLWVSDGAEWHPNGIIVMSRGSTLSAAPTDTIENALVNTPLLAGVLGTSRQLRFKAGLGFSATTNLRTVRARFGGMAGTPFLNSTVTSAGVVAASYEVLVGNSGSASAQLGGGSVGGTVNSNASATVDTSVDTSFVFTVEKSVGSDAVNLRTHSLELLP